MRSNTLKTILLVLGSALILGSLSVLYTTKYFAGFQTERHGLWHNMPLSSSYSYDPYKIIYEMRRAFLPLGRTEGLSFWADRDDNGQFLYPNCTYLLDGTPLQTEFFTLYAANDDLDPLHHNDYPTALSSFDLLFQENEHFIIHISRYPQTNNWLPVFADHPYKLVLNLYNTPFVSPSGLHQLILPNIKRLFCGAPR